MVEKSLRTIAEASRRYGSDPMYVFGGGGNTSFKTEGHLYVKPSGVVLATIQPDGFVKMDRAAIRDVYGMEAPDEATAREALIKRVMAAAVCPDSSGRPSVEAPLHELLPATYVVHMHPVLVNGMTCSANGEEVCRRLFPDAMWVEFIDPGYTLAVEIHERLDDFVAKAGYSPKMIFLQSHGVFISADTIEEIDAMYEQINVALQAEYDQAGVTHELDLSDPDVDTAMATAPPLRTWLGTETARAAVKTSGYFEPVPGALSPDHIVYAKSYALTEEPTAASIAAFEAKHGYQPAIVAIEGKALFSIGNNVKTAQTVLDAACNARQVLQLTQAFGGPRYMTDREREFIENWEVESYRKKLSEGGGGAKRMQGKIILVTGGAQGFGLGIAESMAAQGANLILADLNEDGANAAAAAMNEKFGEGVACAVAVNVGDEESVAAMAQKVVLACGGLDVLVSNAGVLRAGSVKTLDKRDWDLVNAVNYSGYFLCVKHLAQVMAAQNVDGNKSWMDIIQVSSKSGLQGSNRNSAYAGSKFGGIGLTQSFAMELVDDCIKVNSVCPGNFFDGPLWSDPEKGLFVQYLASNKVPGAKTIEEVKAFYEAKVPMNRGCYPDDVAKAIMYAVDQQYETGQAIPITGGQVMLK